MTPDGMVMVVAAMFFLTAFIVIGGVFAKLYEKHRKAEEYKKSGK